MAKLTKTDVIAILRDIAALLDFHGESVFKVRAYENAAAALAADNTPFEQLLSSRGKLESLSGIGKSTAEVIREAAQLGTSPYHQRLRSGTPAGIYQLMQVPNLGVKKIRVLYQKLGISSVEELEAACRDGSIEQVSGFGKKTAERILAAIEQQRRFAGQMLYHHAYTAALMLLEALREFTHVTRVELAGELRRFENTIGHIDIIASSNAPQEVVDFFIAQPGINQVLHFDANRADVLLSADIQASLHLTSDEEFACALHHLTGNTLHNEQIAAHASGLGINVAANGTLLKLDKTGAPTPLSIQTEEEFFAALELDFIAPELREGLGEVEAAHAHLLPELVSLEDYRGVLHCHSTWSDGTSSIADMAREASEQWGLAYLGICDHSEVAAYAGGVKRADLPRQHAEIDELNQSLASRGFRILKGCECDILADGSLDYPDETLETMDFVVASIHSRFQMSGPEMTSRILRAVENPYTTILGHPTGRLLLGRDPYAVDIEQVLEHAAQYPTAIEINADPHRLDLDWRYCRKASQLGLMLSINPDAHNTTGIRNILFGLSAARKGWLEPSQILNCLSLTDFLERAASMREAKRRLSSPRP